MSKRSYVIYVLITLITLLSAAGCGGSGQFPGKLKVGPATSPTVEDTAYPARGIALAAALAEVDAYKPGAGADELVLAELKAELKQVFIDLYGGDPAARDARRQTMALPPDDWNRAWCLQASTTPSGVAKLKWRGRHTGDYNLDGLVTVADLTPLGFHFNVAPDYDADGLPVVSGDNEWAAEVDGDVNGLVAVSDLTPIGANYQSRHMGYRIYLGSGPDADNITWAVDFLPNPDDTGQPFTVPFNTSRDAGHVAKYTFDFTPDPPAIGELNYVRIVAWDGSAEGVERIIPILDGPHAPLSCELCHVMPTLAFREPAGSCHLCHATPPEDSQATWSDPPMLHQPCMNCHVPHGFTIDPPQTPCSTCHGSIASAVSGAGMPNCLGCHATPHIPNPQPTAVDCRSCHTAPPDLPEESWDNAPGLHASCLSCHNEHGFAIAAPNSICADCHGALIDAGHSGGNPDCLGCHASPHIPQTAATGMNCFACHANPPEDLTAEWADAPGNHAQCILCHSGEDHGDKPVPPESICGNCHGELISGGHAGGDTACLGCHEFPHLPVMSFPNCLDCHSAPPENPAADWDDAPGQHDQCAQCHPGPEHGDKPVPPESICGNCHGELISEGHAGGETACLGCHQYPHLPVEPADLHDLHSGEDDVNCQDCHSVHGGMDPDRDTCLACHEEMADHHPSILCTDCHSGR